MPLCSKVHFSPKLELSGSEMLHLSWRKGQKAGLRIRTNAKRKEKKGTESRGGRRRRLGIATVSARCWVVKKKCKAESKKECREEGAPLPPTQKSYDSSLTLVGSESKSGGGKILGHMFSH